MKLNTALEQQQKIRNSISSHVRQGIFILVTIFVLVSKFPNNEQQYRVQQQQQQPLVVEAWTQRIENIPKRNHIKYHKGGIFSSSHSHKLQQQQRQQQQQDRSCSGILLPELHSTAADSSSSSSSDLITKSDDTSDTDKDDEVDDDDEYEYVEYDNLTEQDFILSEWMVGTNWDNKPNTIDETWVRLITDNDGKNVAIWGDNSKGTWTFDVPSQFLSISKENILAGKQIWACTISDNYYYIQGTVRGWTYWLPAAVLGQWQAKRLGIDPKEAGTPPWFETTTSESDVDDASALATSE